MMLRLLSLCVSLVLASGALAQSRQIVNVGTTPNDGTGDPFRTAIIKLNANDSNLWNQAFVTQVATNVGLGAAVAKRVVSVASMAELRTINVDDFPAGTIFSVASYYGDGNGGGGNYTVTNTITGTNALGGRILALGGAKSLEVSNESGVVNVLQFGAIADGSVTATNLNVQAINAAWTMRNGKPVYVPAGRYAINGTINITSGGNDRSFRLIGAGANDNDGTEILQYGGNQTIMTLSGAAPEVSGFTLRWPGGMRPLSTDTNAVALRLNTVFNGVIRDMNLVNCGVQLRCSPGHSQFSTLFESISGYGFSQFGLDLSGVGTQQTFVKCDFRNSPALQAGYLNTGSAANSGSTVTITMPDTFCTNLVAGQLIIMSGMSPPEFNGIFTVYSPTSTTFQYILPSSPSGPVSGTPQAINYYGSSTGRAIYIAPGNRAHFFGLNVEYNISPVQIECLGWAGFYGCSFEGFMGVSAANPFIFLAQGGDLSSVQVFNITAPAGSAYHLFSAPAGAVINLGNITTRDLYYVGASLNWMTGGGRLYAAHHFKDTTARSDRTSELSSQIPNSRLLRPSGFSIDNIEFALDGLNDRRAILGPSYLDSRDNITGLGERAFTLLPNHTAAGQLFVYSASTVNTAFQFEAGTADRRLLLRGNGLQALSNSGAAPLALTLNNDGGDIILRRKTVVGPATGLEASAALQINSTTQGFLPPKMTTAERDAIGSPTDGLMIYNITTSKAQVRAAGVWVDLH